MSRRTCEFKHPDPAATADRCRLCWLYANRPDYRALWDKDGPPPAPAPAPCRYRGELALAGRVAAFGLNPARQWFDCGKGHGTGGLVCPCQGCGPGCPDYAADPG
jgi:hypothetical protein